MRRAAQVWSTRASRSTLYLWSPLDKSEHCLRLAVRGGPGERALRELDHERAPAREAMVLPVRRGSARPADGAEPHPGQARVLPRDRPARAPRTHERLWLVAPDRHRRLDSADEASGGACLRLRERFGPGVLGVPGPAAGSPLGREVAVEVDASRVLAPAEREAVRVEVRHDPEIDGRRGVGQDARDRGAGALVSVDAADDERARRARRVAGAERPERAAACRAADAYAALRIGGDADVHVIVVVDQPLNFPFRPAEADVRPDEDLHSSRAHEPSHELL